MAALEEVAREVSLLAQKHAYELDLMFQRLQGRQQRLGRPWMPLGPRVSSPSKGR